MYNASNGESSQRLLLISSLFTSLDMLLFGHRFYTLLPGIMLDVSGFAKVWGPRKTIHPPLLEKCSLRQQNVWQYTRNVNQKNQSNLPGIASGLRIEDLFQRFFLNKAKFPHGCLVSIEGRQKETGAQL